MVPMFSCPKMVGVGVSGWWMAWASVPQMAAISMWTTTAPSSGSDWGNSHISSGLSWPVKTAAWLLLIASPPPGGGARIAEWGTGE